MLKRVFFTIKSIKCLVNSILVVSLQCVNKEIVFTKPQDKTIIKSEF